MVANKINRIKKGLFHELETTEDSNENWRNVEIFLDLLLTLILFLQLLRNENGKQAIYLTKYAIKGDKVIIEAVIFFCVC